MGQVKRAKLHTRHRPGCAGAATARTQPLVPGACSTSARTKLHYLQLAVKRGAENFLKFHAGAADVGLFRLSAPVGFGLGIAAHGFGLISTTSVSVERMRS